MPLVVLLGIHRPEQHTAQARAEPEAACESVSAFLRRWVAPLGELQPGLTLPALRDHSFRDIASLILTRQDRLIAAQKAAGPDLQEDVFGEVS